MKWKAGKFYNELGSIVTNGAYISYLGNYRVIEKIYAYAFSEEEVHLDEENFLRDLVERSARAIQASEVPVSVSDEGILREFYKQLLEKIKKFVRNTKGMEQRELLYQINQVGKTLF